LSWNFLQFPVTSYLFSPNIFLSTLFSNTLNLHSFLNVTDQVSHPFFYISLYKGRPLQGSGQRMAETSGNLCLVLRQSPTLDTIPSQFHSPLILTTISLRSSLILSSHHFFGFPCDHFWRAFLSIYIYIYMHSSSPSVKINEHLTVTLTAVGSLYKLTSCYVIS
jgi:hypothetical protein